MHSAGLKTISVARPSCRVFPSIEKVKGVSSHCGNEATESHGPTTAESTKTLRLPIAQRHVEAQGKSGDGAVTSQTQNDFAFVMNAARTGGKL